MPKSPSLTAINAPMAASSGSSMASQASDLPLRNFPLQLDLAADPRNMGKLPTPSSAFGLLPDIPPETPSSVTAEFGDDSTIPAPPPAVITEKVLQPYSRSRSRSGAPSERSVRDSSRSNTPTPRRSSPSEHGSPSWQRREPNTNTASLNEKVQKFLLSIPQDPPAGTVEELVRENRSLHQRIAALQLTERELLSDNQDFARRLTANQKRHDTRRRQWKQELENREKVSEARIKGLEARLARQEEELMRIALERSTGTTLTDNAIMSWLSTKAGAWRAWAEDFSHRDQHRLQSGLHPVQVLELCEGVKHFVQLTENGELPNELLTLSDAGDGVQVTQLLLHGMLSNFIISEILASPFWVFDVLSARGLELESPSVKPMNPGSPVGFRMDLAMWNFTVAPPRDARLPQSPTVAAAPQATSHGIGKLPRLATSVRPLVPSITETMSLLDQNLPSRQEMEGLYHVLCNGMSPSTTDGYLLCRILDHKLAIEGLANQCFKTSPVRGGVDNARVWRSAVMKAFCEGGMSTEVDSAVTESVRVLAEARHAYAGRLKDVFLRGATRFLLQDQDAAGIEKLERRLLREIDAALRFSCQLWCRQDTPRVRGFRDLLSTTFKSSNNWIELWQGQAPVHHQFARESSERGDAPPGHHDGQPILMVIQPAIEVGTATQAKANSKVWAKAKVLVATPLLSQEQPATTNAASPKTVPAGVVVEKSHPLDTPPPAPTKTLRSPPKDPKGAGLVMLPNVAFNATTRSSSEAFAEHVWTNN